MIKYRSFPKNVRYLHHQCFIGFNVNVVDDLVFIKNPTKMTPIYRQMKVDFRTTPSINARTCSGNGKTG